MSECEAKVVRESALSRYDVGETGFAHILDVEPGSYWEVWGGFDQPVLEFSGPRVAVPLFKCDKAESMLLKKRYSNAVILPNEEIRGLPASGHVLAGFYREKEAAATEVGGSYTEAETAIHNAILKVEALPPSYQLAEVEVLLGDALKIVKLESEDCDVLEENSRKFAVIGEIERAKKKLDSLKVRGEKVFLPEEDAALFEGEDLLGLTVISTTGVPRMETAPEFGRFVGLILPPK